MSDEITIVTTNRKAFHDFKIVEKFEAGIELVGSEVKSLREGRANLRDAYATFREGGVVLNGMHIGPYSKEGPTIKNIHRFAEEQSHRSQRKHHEIYLSDPYRSKPENLRTVIRQLVTKQWPCLSVSTGLTGKSL